MLQGWKATLVATVALVGAAPGVAHAADKFTIKTLHFGVTVGPNDDKQCDVIADLYTPNGVDKAHPAPAVLSTNGFGGSKASQARLGRGFANRGYVFLAYSGLGFGGSGCQVTIDDRDYDGKAGSQLITFLGGGSAAKDGTKIDYVVTDAKAHDGTHHDFDPRVGMIGGSYGGQVQFAVAGIDPRLDTIAPSVTWSDLAYSLAPNNTSFLDGVSYGVPGAMKLVWATGFFGLGVVNGVAPGLQNDPSRLLPCPNYDIRVCTTALTLLSTGAPTDATVDFLRHASVRSFVSDIKIPTLISQGQRDSLFNLQESVATYRSLKAQGTPVKLTWQLGGHSGAAAPGEGDELFEKATPQTAMFTEWFDHYLKDAKKKPSLDFTFFRDWIKYTGDATPAYGRSADYPVVKKDTDYHLSGTTGLATGDEPVKTGSATFLTTALGIPTSYTNLPVVNPSAAPIDVPGTSASYSTPALTADKDVIGVPSIDLRIDSPIQALTGQVGSIGELVFFARLEDVSPDGSALLPKQLVSPVRVSNTTVPVHVELPGIVHRFPKGHKIRLVLYGGDLAFRAGNLPGPMTVLTDAGRPSTLHLPIAAESTYGPIVRAAAPCSGKRVVRVGAPSRLKGRVGSSRVVVKGRTVGRVKGMKTRRVTLAGKAGSKVAVKVVSRLKSGRSVTTVRRFTICG